MAQENQAAANAAEYHAWLAPSGALELLKHLTTQQAIRGLYDRLRYGHIRSMARRWNYKQETREFWPIPAKVWADGEHGIAVSDFWQIGQITIPALEQSAAYGYQTFQLALFGVRFDPAGVRELLPPDTASAPSTLQAEVPSTSIALANKGGRPRKGWWDDLWVEMARQLYAGDLKPKRQGDIENAMNNWVSAQNHEGSERIIREAARKLWNAISSEGKN